MKAQHWQDVVLLVLALWLFLSPFVLQGYETGGGIAAWNSYVPALLIAALAIWSLMRPRHWEEWAQVALGLWLIISPFVLGFPKGVPGWNTTMIGLLVTLVASWALAVYPKRGG